MDELTDNPLLKPLVMNNKAKEKLEEDEILLNFAIGANTILWQGKEEFKGKTALIEKFGYAGAKDKTLLCLLEGGRVAFKRMREENSSLGGS